MKLSDRLTSLQRLMYVQDVSTSQVELAACIDLARRLEADAASGGQQGSLWPTATPVPDGVKLKQAGQALAMTGLTEEYKAAFYDEVQRWADTGNIFTSEDITDVVGLPKKSGTHKNNGVGALMSGAAKKKMIRKVPGKVKARNARSHAHEITRWIGYQWTREKD